MARKTVKIVRKAGAGKTAVTDREGYDQVIKLAHSIIQDAELGRIGSDDMGNALIVTDGFQALEAGASEDGYDAAGLPGKEALDQEEWKVIQKTCNKLSKDVPNMVAQELTNQLGYKVIPIYSDEQPVGERFLKHDREVKDGGEKVSSPRYASEFRRVKVRN